jgi:hypothetical protein
MGGPLGLATDAGATSEEGLAKPNMVAWEACAIEGAMPGS